MSCTAVRHFFRQHKDVLSNLLFLIEKMRLSSSFGHFRTERNLNDLFNCARFINILISKWLRLMIQRRKYWFNRKTMIDITIWKSFYQQMFSYRLFIFIQRIYNEHFSPYEFSTMSTCSISCRRKISFDMLKYWIFNIFTSQLSDFLLRTHVLHSNRVNDDI